MDDTDHFLQGTLPIIPDEGNFENLPDNYLEESSSSEDRENSSTLSTLQSNIHTLEQFQPQQKETLLDTKLIFKPEVKEDAQCLDQSLKNRLDSLFNNLASQKRGNVSFKNICKMLEEKPQMAGYLEEKINFVPRDWESKEKDVEYQKRIVNSIKALKLLGLEGKDLKTSALCQVLHIAAESKGYLQSIIADFLFKNVEENKQSLLQHIFNAHFSKLEYLKLQLDHEQEIQSIKKLQKVQQMEKQDAKNDFVSLNKIVQNIWSKDFENQRSIIDTIVFLICNMQNFIFVDDIKEILDTLIENIKTNQPLIKGKDLLQYIEEKFGIVQNIENAFLSGNQNICVDLLENAKEILQNMQIERLGEKHKEEHKNEPESEGSSFKEQEKIPDTNKAQNSAETANLSKPSKLLKYPKFKYQKAVHDGRSFREIIKEFKKLNNDLKLSDTGLIEKLKVLYDAFERGYASPSNIYPCIYEYEEELYHYDPECLEEDLRHQVGIKKVKPICHYDNQDIKNWAQEVYKARVSKKSFYQLKKHTVQENTRLIKESNLLPCDSKSNSKGNSRVLDSDPSCLESSDDQSDEEDSRKAERNELVLINDLEFLPEILAIIKQAELLFCGHTLRSTQALAILLCCIEEDQGALLQVKTGEGKSAITSFLATICSLKGRVVDVITSSKTLAIRDVEKRQNFFQMFDFSVDHNCKEDSGKDCYTKDIVYGSIANFQFDYLRDSQNKIGSKIRELDKRPFDIVIIDEIDSMCIDNSSNLAMISSSIPGSVYLGIIYAGLTNAQGNFRNGLATLQGPEGQEYKFLILAPFEIKDNQIIIKDEQGNDIPEGNIEYQEKKLDLPSVNYAYRKYLQAQLEHSLSQSNMLPAYHEKFAKLQENAWIKSAISAGKLFDNEQYIIYKNTDGEYIIAPVDLHNTGVIHSNTQWTNGQHQLLQFEHQLIFFPESLVSNAISIFGYLKLYSTTFGMTGTIGDKDEQGIIKSGRNINVFFVPTNKAKNFEEYQGIITENKAQHVTTLERSISEETAKGRSILVICPTIKFVNELHKILEKKYSSKVRIYCNGETDLSAISKPADSGDIIVATNLSGRGADIKNTHMVEINGGLHVIMTLLPVNSRVQEQNMGRTSRQGNNGSAQLIINREEAAITVNLNLDSIKELSLEDLKALRDEKQTAMNHEYILYKSHEVELKDRIYSNTKDFCKNLPCNKAKHSQLVEEIGLFGRSFEEDIEDNKGKAAFEDRLHQKGYIVTWSKSNLDSMFHSICHQIGGQYTGSNLKFLAMQEIAIGSNINKEEFHEKLISILNSKSDEEILQIITNILGRDIELIKNSSIDPFLIYSSRSIKSTSPLRLSSFINKQTGQVSYQSLMPWDEAYYSTEFKEEKLFSAKINLEYIDALSKNEAYLDLCLKEYQEIYFQIESTKAIRTNEKILDYFEKKLEKFKESILAVYHQDYNLVRNPAYLTRQGLDERSTHLTKLAKDRDHKFSHAAEHAEAFIRLDEGGNRNHRADEPDEIVSYYVQPCIAALAAAIEKLGNEIAQYEAAVILGVKNLKSPLNKQHQDMIDLDKKLIQHVEKIIKVFQNCNYSSQYVALGKIKDLKSLYEDPDSAPKAAIMKLSEAGIHFLFEAKLFSIPEPDTDWFSGFCMLCLSVIQVAVGFVCVHFGFTKLGVQLIYAGLCDIGTAIDIFEGKPFSWQDYWSKKGVTLAIAVATEFGGRFLDHMGLTNSAGSLFAQEVTTGAFGDTMRIVAENLAVTFAVDKVIHGAQNQAAKALVATFKHQVQEVIEDKINEYFAQEDVKAKISEIIAAKRSDDLRSIINSAFGQSKNDLRTIFREAMRNISGSSGAHIGLKVLGAAWELKEAENAIESVSSKISRMLGQIDKQISHLALSLPSDQERLRQYLSLLTSSEDDISVALKAFEQEGIIVNEKIIENIESLNSSDLNLPQAFEYNNWSITDKIKSIIKSRQVSYEQEIGAIKGTLSKFAVTYATGQLHRYVATPFVREATAGIEKSLTEKIRNLSHKIFNAPNRAEIARQKEEAKLKLKLQSEELEHKIQKVMEEQETLLEKTRNKLQIEHNNFFDNNNDLDPASSDYNSSNPLDDRLNYLIDQCESEQLVQKLLLLENDDDLSADDILSINEFITRLDVMDSLNTKGSSSSSINSDAETETESQSSSQIFSQSSFQDSTLSKLYYARKGLDPEYNNRIYGKGNTTVEITLADVADGCIKIQEFWDNFSANNPKSALAIKIVGGAGTIIGVTVMTSGSATGAVAPTVINSILASIPRAMLMNAVAGEQIEQAKEFASNTLTGYLSTFDVTPEQAAALSSTLVAGLIEGTNIYSAAKSGKQIGKDLNNSSSKIFSEETSLKSHTFYSKKTPDTKNLSASKDLTLPAGDSKVYKDKISKDFIPEYAIDSKLKAPADVIRDNPILPTKLLRELKDVTGMSVHPEQIKILKEIVRKHDFKQLAPDSSKAYRNKFFTPAAKAEIRAEWEATTGRKWPVYQENIYSKDGRKIRGEGKPLDIHHIIHNSHGGPHAHFNAHPVTLDQHDKIHYDPNSVAKQIFKAKVPENGK